MLATFLWAYVRYTQTPWSQVVSQVALDLPLKLDNIDPQLVALHSPETVKVIVKGPPDALENLRPEHCKAYIDLNGKPEGPYYLPVSVNVPPRLSVIDREPSQVHLQLDAIDTKSFPLKARIHGRPAEGFQVGEVTFQPEKVTVRGPSSLLATIHDVLLEASVQGAKTDLVQRSFPQPVDAEGNLVSQDHLQISPSQLLLDVSITGDWIPLQLVVHPTLTGKPDEGYSLKEVIVTPLIVKAEVPRTVKTLPGIIITTPVSLKGVSSSIVREVALVPPVKGTILEVKSVKVKINLIKI
jgi:YbbR domain-containing protein